MQTSCYILISFMFICFSCADNNHSSLSVKEGKRDLLSLSKDSLNSEHIYGIEKLIKGKQSESLLYFGYKSDMGTKDDKDKSTGGRKAVPFQIKSKEINGDTLTVILEGIQGAGGFKGNIEIKPDEIILYYWYDEDIEMVHHREHYNLSYLIKLPATGKEYALRIVGI